MAAWRLTKTGRSYSSAILCPGNDKAKGNITQATTGMRSKWDESDYVFLSKADKLKINYI